MVSRKAGGAIQLMYSTPMEIVAMGEGCLHVDDESVRAVQHEDVIGGDYSGQTNNRCPYMLFCCRTTSTGTLIVDIGSVRIKT